MLKIIKYEWMHRFKFFLAGFVVCILLNIELVRNIINKNQGHQGTILYVGILIALAFAFGIGLGIDHIRRMYKSLFTEEGYFLFTTPLSGYGILGGKLITIILECLGITFLGGILFFIDYKILLNRFPEIEITSEIPAEIVINLFKFFMLILFGYITLLLMIYLAMVLARSIFSAVRYGKLLSFIFFIMIAQVVGKITSYIGKATETVVYVEMYGDAHFPTVTNEYFLLQICIVGALFMITGYLIDRKINI
ncbi:hypothetical protein [Marinisporobacter balticus]|uniref:ABC-2 family transporter n=1 Tax=Marinisporobacter balticus TaxID=2018667 RepID=A0A4R2KM63_9FIRM|nr:hypothetical protein [Marinisporobacter balticus]TCO74783.1 hypothetical protein EV214_11145 [Marinisporobacter balticus]